MTRHQLTVDVHGDHVHLDVARLPSDLRPVVAAALVQHLGLDLVTLAKAGGGEGPDPRFPELERLVEEMRTRWSRWTSWLVDRLTDALTKKRATPAVVAGLLEVHDAGVTAATTGATIRPTSEPLVVDPALIPPSPELNAPIAVAFRLGREVDPDLPPRIPGAPREPERTLSLVDQASIAYARSRAAIYMRRPITSVQQTAQRILLDDGIPLDPRALTAEQLGTVGATVASSIEHGESVKKTSERLRDALSDATITNDLDRVARTEIAFAHHWGAYAALRSQIPRGDDPTVYKITNNGACSECIRIWGFPANPVLYRLSVVEAFSASGGNYRKPRKDWGPTIGPTHPNCFPAGVPVTTAGGDLPIERVRVGDLVLTHTGRWRRVIATMDRAYRGRMVETNGVPATAEHPFLTPHGWIAAGDLVLGDQVFEPRKVAFSESDDAPSVRDEMRFLLAVCSHLLRGRVPVAPIDLDRDERARDREIDQEPPDGVSWLRRHAERLQRIVEPLFEIGTDPARLGVDLSDHLFLGLGPPSDDSMSGLCLLSALLWSQPIGADLGRFRRGSRGDPERAQPLPHDVATAAQTLRHLEHGQAVVDMHPSYRLGVDVLTRGRWGTGPSEFAEPSRHPRAGHPDLASDRGRAQPLIEVESMKQIEVEIPRFGSHALLPVEVRTLVQSSATVRVYNLSVQDDESFIAGGLVTHNCTCPPLLRWNPAVHDAVQDAAAEMRKIFG